MAIGSSPESDEDERPLQACLELENTQRDRFDNNYRFMQSMITQVDSSTISKPCTQNGSRMTS